MFSALRQHRSFAHGIHPPQGKDDTRNLPIKQFPFAPVMIVPLLQHIGKPALAVVREGQEVERGQLIAEPDGFVSVAMHAPASGVIQRIALAPGINGRMTPAIYLKPFPGSSQEVIEGTPCDHATASAGEILLAIQRAGIVGLGGAAFPTHVKLKVPD
ncbi:MAG: electron transport complex subunit RsxC, partial [Halioglobus sp.]